MSDQSQHKLPEICGKVVTVSGRFVRTIRLRSERSDVVEDPDAFIASIRTNLRADLFSFVQPVSAPAARYPYHVEYDKLAVLHFDTYESWWKKQLNDKTRNMVRKAEKKGCEIRTVILDDKLVKEIKELYDESPIRQGRPFRHYGKDLQTLRETHLSFVDRSEFIGAYLEGKLIGFIKMVYLKESANLMQIIAMVAHRDKAPTNALLAKAVELCSAKNIHCIQYGIWSRRTLGEFKKHHRFEMLRVARYYVPLNLRGKIALKLGLHRNLIDLVPEPLVDWMADLRGRWYARKTAAKAA